MTYKIYASRHINFRAVQFCSIWSTIFLSPSLFRGCFLNIFCWNKIIVVELICWLLTRSLTQGILLLIVFLNCKSYSILSIQCNIRAHMAINSQFSLLHIFYYIYYIFLLLCSTSYFPLLDSTEMRNHVVSTHTFISFFNINRFL